MKLYMVPLAPNPTRVTLYIAERLAQGAEIEVEQIVVNTLKGLHKEPEHRARNPFATLPVLERDDGPPIIESRTIIDYLEDRFEKARLFDADYAVRAYQRDIERICEIRVGNIAALWVHMVRSPLGVAPDPAQAEKCLAQMQPGLRFLDDMLADGRVFLCGPQVSVADCTLQAFFQFMRYAQVSVLDEFPHLVAWDAQYRSRPLVSELLML